MRTDGADGPGAAPMIGLSGGHPASVAVPMFTVADIRAAARDVRAAGGTCTDPAPAGYGTAAECTDDQGARFDLVQY